MREILLFHLGGLEPPLTVELEASHYACPASMRTIVQLLIDNGRVQ